MNATPQFRMTPGQTELADIPRDLRFHPSTVSQPRILTVEQVVAYNRHGFLRGIRVFSPEEIAGQRRYFDGLLARVLAAGGVVLLSLSERWLPSLGKEGKRLTLAPQVGREFGLALGGRF